MRIFWLKNLIILLFAILFSGLFYIQVVDHYAYNVLARQNRIRPVNIDSPRGIIYDRDGRALAYNQVVYDCTIVPQELRRKETVIAALAEILDSSSVLIKKHLAGHREAPFVPVVIQENISKDIIVKIEENSLDLPGVFVEPRIRRRYHHAKALSHVVGYLGEVSREELNLLKDYGYRPRDVVGRTGVESFYNDYLKGSDGGMQIEIDYLGRKKRILSVKDPRPGIDLTLTIDTGIQNALYELLKPHRAAGIVMAVDTGEIIALVSTPGFDPHVFIESDQYALISRLFRDAKKPLLNRAIASAFPPGSTFKIITAVAGLDSGMFSEKDAFNCKGYYQLGRRRFHCWRSAGHGWLNIRDAITHSCNVFFYQLGKKIGAKTIAQYAQRYQLDEPTQIDLPGETIGLVPSELWKRIHRRQPWYKGDTLNYSIGQGYLLLTPVALVRALSAVVNGGKLIRPHVVKKIGDQPVSFGKTRHLKTGSAAHRRVMEGMNMVVSDQGTGRLAQVEGVTVGGKTGTAQNPRGEDHAWFMGYAPQKDPEYALVIFVEHGGKGSQIPAEISAEIFKKLFEKG